MRFTIIYAIIIGIDNSYETGNVNYRKLWKLMIDKNIRKKTDLITMVGISTNILAKLNKGDFISMESMQKICKALNCDVGDICVINEVVEEGIK